LLRKGKGYGRKKHSVHEGRKGAIPLTLSYEKHKLKRPPGKGEGESFLIRKEEEKKKKEQKAAPHGEGSGIRDRQFPPGPKVGG